MAWHKGIFPKQKLISCKFDPTRRFSLAIQGEGVIVHDDEEKRCREKEKSWHLARMSAALKIAYACRTLDFKSLKSFI